MPETPIEIVHAPAQLRTRFTGRVPEARSGSAEEREQNFLTRALAAFAVQKISGCAADEAAASVVDGGGDGGIDAVYYSPASSTLYLVQSKFFANGRGEPELGDATKFKEGIGNLLQGNFAAFEQNEAWRRLLPQLQAIFKNRALRVRGVLVYSGINLVSEDRRRLFEDLKSRFSPDSDYYDTSFCALTTVHDWLVDADEGPGVPEVNLTLLKPGWVRSPYETIYGLLPLADLAALHSEHGSRLVAANIRAYKGSTEVNEQISNTIREEPQHFFYLNNGLTAYCRRLEVNNLDRANNEQKRVRALGFSVVNGAQTLGAISALIEERPNPAPAGHVFIKIISLERCADDRAFASRITRSTNYQNQIGSRDFVALDEEQERIANQLTLSGITYHYKDGVETPDPDASNFTMEEATTACACLIQNHVGEYLPRIIANRRSLWSLEDVYPANQENRSRYSRVFRPDRSARTIWRAVQAQRIVIEAMRANARASSGVRKAFFENARWLVLNVLFLRLRPEQGDELQLGLATEQTVSRATIDFAEALWNVCEAQGLVTRSTAGSADPYQQSRHFRSVFSDPADCTRLRGALLARLAAPTAAAPPTPA